MSLSSWLHTTKDNVTNPTRKNDDGIANEVAEKKDGRKGISIWPSHSSSSETEDDDHNDLSFNGDTASTSASPSWFSTTQKNATNSTRRKHDNIVNEVNKNKRKDASDN